MVARSNEKWMEKASYLLALYIFNEALGNHGMAKSIEMKTYVVNAKNIF